MVTDKVPQIGKTSSLVLTLSGVLKNIMIVFASMLFYHDTVTGIQFVGFSIALGGLAYYQLGGAPAFRGFYGQALNRVSEYRQVSGQVDVEMARERDDEVAGKRMSEDEAKSPGIVNIKSA
jgi:hypothetical protein